MIVLITLISIGTDSGPFDLYSNIDGFSVPFATNISVASLTSGYETAVPDNTTIVRAKSLGVCSNYFDITLSPLCFRFLPSDSSYLLDWQIPKDGDGIYIYGNFTNYTYGSNNFNSTRLIRLNDNLTINSDFVATTGLNQVLYLASIIREQDDGKILATGTFTSYKGVSANRIVRINPDGSRDNTFLMGTGFNNFTSHIGIDSLDRIIVLGIYSSYNGVGANRIIRLNPDGTRDNTFVMGSGFNNTSESVIIYPDNSMLVSGYFTSYNGVAVSGGLVKIKENGSRDLTFNSGTGFTPVGYVGGKWNAVYFLQSPGETSFFAFGFFTSYKGGTTKYLIKLTSTGDVDTSFNQGTGLNAEVFFLHKIFDDKLLVHGAFTSYNGIASHRNIILNPDGSVFLTFDEDPLDTGESDTFVIGNDVYLITSYDCIKKVYTYIPPITTTTTTIGITL